MRIGYRPYMVASLSLIAFGWGLVEGNSGFTLERLLRIPEKISILAAENIREAYQKMTLSHRLIKVYDESYERVKSGEFKSLKDIPYADMT